MKKLLTLLFIVTSLVAKAQPVGVKISALPNVPGPNLDSTLVPLSLNGTTYKAFGYMFGSSKMDSISISS